MKRCVVVFLFLIMSLITLSACTRNKERQLIVTSEDIALLSIYADDGKSESNFLLRNYGHAFLSVKNISENNITVGDRLVVPNETITIGLWNILEHFGVWYNIEGNYISEYDKYSHRVSLTIGINTSDIEEISNMIAKSDRWSPFFNCSTFAMKTWNLVAEDSEKIDSKLLVSPKYLVNKITKFSGHEKNRECITDTDFRKVNK